MVLGKINKFLYLFILGKISQEKVFCNVLDRKLVFLDNKSNDFKKVAKYAFFQFGQNFEISFSFFFRLNRPRNSV